MTDDQLSAEQQAQDDDLARIVDALEESGLVELDEQADGTTTVRLTEKGESLRQALPEFVEDDPG